MTYDPYRDPNRNEPTRDPHRDYGNADRSGAGAGILLAALLLAAIGGFIYFFTGPADQVATNDTRPPITQTQPSTTGSGPSPETTGSSANMPPAPEPRIEPKVKPVE